MFDRFTDRSKRVLNLARQEAQRLKQDIGTAHILFGLAEESSGIAHHVLQNASVSAVHIRQQCGTGVPKAGDTLESGRTGQIPFTERARCVFKFAMEEATKLGHNWIGTEHLLLGILDEVEGDAAIVLRNLGLDTAKLRGDVLNALGVLSKPQEAQQALPQLEVHRRLAKAARAYLNAKRAWQANYERTDALNQAEKLFEIAVLEVEAKCT